MIETSVATFKQDVLECSQPVIVDFWSPHCIPCKLTNPQFAKAAEALPNVRFVKCNVDDCLEIAQEYGIKSIPSLVLFQHGKAEAIMKGMHFKRTIIKFCNYNIDAS